MEKTAQMKCRCMLHRTEVDKVPLYFVGFNPIVRSALSIIENRVLPSFASCNPYFTGHDCRWTYQTVGSFNLPTNVAWDVHLICAIPDRRRKLKGSSSSSSDDSVYNHVAFSDECGCLHTDDSEACVEENSAHQVVIRECSSSSPMAEDQTWIVV